MRNEQLRKQHIEAFAKLSLSERLSWSFMQHRFLSGFMNVKAKQINKNIRRNGKLYSREPNLVQDN